VRQVDLFAGIGCFAWAGEAEGFEVVAAVNHWPLAVKVHAANHPNVAHYCRTLVTQADPDARFASEKFDFALLPQFDLLTAGMACQGHSRGGRVGRKQSKKVADEHENLRATAWAVVECLEVCRPKHFIVENVIELLDWELLDLWLACLERLGYAVTKQVLCASRWEVGQRRVRIFVIGTHEGRPVAVEDPNVPETGVESVFDDSLGGWRLIEDMRKTVSKKGYKTAREKVEIANVRLGGALGWGQHTNYNAWGRAMSEPCPTLTTKPAMLWWVRDGQYRLWADSELAAAMTFPRDYDLCGVGRVDAAKLIGNAVPVNLARGVIREVLRQAG